MIIYLWIVSECEIYDLCAGERLRNSTKELSPARFLHGVGEGERKKEGGEREGVWVCLYTGQPEIVGCARACASQTLFLPPPVPGMIVLWGLYLA